jgi:hypothetical protein
MNYVKPLDTKNENNELAAHSTFGQQTTENNS